MQNRDIQIKKFLTQYTSQKSPIFNTNRLIILLLHYMYIDGIQFRELQVVLEISDGKLIADLGVLVKSGYLEKHKTKLDNKELEYYTISQKGRNEIENLQQLFTFKGVN